MLEWLGSTALARMVQESMWGYPIVLSAHAVGMAIFGGLAVVINLRVLGVARGMTFDGLKSMYRASWVGLVINAISGFMLFSADAERFFYSTPFRIKIILLTTAIVLLVVMSRKVFPDPPLSEGVAPVAARVLAALQLLCLLGVIVAGRLIAYLD